MAAHKRTSSESTAVFVPHTLSFAGTGEEQDKYYAAQRYDWDDVPPKLAEARAPYELTQPFDYIIPKKKKGQALGANNTNASGDADGVARKKMGRPRKDAVLVDAEENTPAHSVEPDIGRHLPKKRGRPRRSEASRKTDDGDNTADESYVQPGETWKAGTKRRGAAPQNQPAKKPRISKTAETDDEQETAPLRSGGARSRATPLKPQQANRWSNTEDRQLIDSLFEVLGSIPWRRVTAYMAERGYPCADRGEGAIRGRWKVLRPRLYIVPPPVVRGAAAKSQMKAREKEAAGREEGDGGAEDEGEADADGEDAPEDEMDVDPKEPERTQPTEEHRAEMTVDVEGDTTVEEDDVPPSARQPQRTANAEGNQTGAPITPASNLPAEQPNAASGPPKSKDKHSLGPQLGDQERTAPASSKRSALRKAAQKPPQPPNQPHTSPNPPPFALPSHSPPTNLAHHPVPDRALPQTPNPPRHEPQQTQTQSQPLHASPNLTHRSPQPRDSKDPRFYTHPSSTTPRLSEHPAFQSTSPYAPPVNLPGGLSPIRHPPSPDRQALPSLPSRVLSPSSGSPGHGYSSHVSEERHLVQGQDGRHLTHPPPIPQPQQFSPAPVWPARVERPYEENPFEDRGRVHESTGERGFHTSGERGYHASPERYQTSGERERGHHTSPGRDFQTSSERGFDRYQYESGRERDRSRGRDAERPAKGRKPEMLPFPVTHPPRSRETSYTPYHATTPASYQGSFQTSPYQPHGSPYQGQAAQVFPPPPLYVPPQSLFTAQEMVPGGSRLPVLGERTPPGPVRETSSRKPREGEARRGASSKKAADDGQRKASSASHAPSSKKAREIVTKNLYDGGSSSQGSALSEVPDSTAGDSDL